jgi:hypothetical protein
MIKYKSKVHVCKNSYIVVIDMTTNKEVARAFIDTEDTYRVAQYRWGLNKDGYLQSSIKSKKIPLHRFLLNLEVGDSKIVDHIDRNIHNNRKSNLRLCSQTQNHGNSSLSKRNTSGYKGVCWNKYHKKWQAQIRKDYKEIYLGLFDLVEDAAMAYNDAAITYFGEFAVLNSVI